MKYLADSLSLLRALALVPVVLFSCFGEWKLAFIALCLGWATDMVDGTAARKWGSLRDRKPNFDADGIADSVLAFGSTAVVATYVAYHYSFGWVAYVVWGVTLVTGTVMALMMNAERTPLRRWLVAFNMVVFHGIVQIVCTIAWFAAMSYDTFTGVVIGVGLASLSTEFFGKKILLWLDGEFEPPAPAEGK